MRKKIRKITICPFCSKEYSSIFKTNCCTLGETQKIQNSRLRNVQKLRHFTITAPTGVTMSRVQRKTLLRQLNKSLLNILLDGTCRICKKTESSTCWEHKIPNQ